MRISNVDVSVIGEDITTSEVLDYIERYRALNPNKILKEMKIDCQKQYVNIDYIYEGIKSEQLSRNV